MQIMSELAPSRPQTLPLPDKVSGFAELTVDEWISLGPLITFALLVLTLVAQGFTSSAPKDSEWCAYARRRVLQPPPVAPMRNGPAANGPDVRAARHAG